MKIDRKERKGKERKRERPAAAVFFHNTSQCNSQKASNCLVRGSLQGKGKTRQDRTRQDKRQATTMQDKTRRDETRQDKTTRQRRETRQDKLRQRQVKTKTS